MLTAIIPLTSLYPRYLTAMNEHSRMCPQVMRKLLALSQNLGVTTQSNSAANNPIMRTFAQPVGHALGRTLPVTLLRRGSFSFARTASMKRVARTRTVEEDFIITGMERCDIRKTGNQTRVMKGMMLSAARSETAMSHKSMHVLRPLKSTIQSHR